MEAVFCCQVCTYILAVVQIMYIIPSIYFQLKNNVYNNIEVIKKLQKSTEKKGS